MSEDTHPLLPVVLAGGSGTRLWPLSRPAYPKQFAPLVHGRSLFELTLERVAAVTERAPLVVTNEAHRFMAAEALRSGGVDGAPLLLEPAGRNTAPAIALAAHEARADGGDPTLLVLPSDHLIGDVGRFAEAVDRAAAEAIDGALVTFGVAPDAPVTGYGYIRAAPGEGPRAVAAFVEKPDRATAERYLAEGGYYWNSGMFVFRASAYLDALARHAPEMAAAVEAVYAGRQTDADFVRFDEAAFRALPAESIDYAVMERAERARVVPLATTWSDVGSWSALHEAARAMGDTDDAGNAVQGDVIAHDTRDSTIHAGHRLVATVGLSDCVVVETADAVLVAPTDRAQEVKRVVDELGAGGRSERDTHRRVYRPWGSYEGLDNGERFQVKRIVVEPGGQLSLQMHHHRAEHWVVVRGTARVTHGDRSFLLSENESTYIPLGTAHRLENPGRIPLELIEVQTGTYLGEDDIVRFDDRYGR